MRQSRPLSSREWIAIGLVVVAGAAIAAVLLSTGPDETVPRIAPRDPAPEFHESDIPRIDVHTHIGLEMVRETLAIMDQNHVVLALNASGGVPGGGLERSIEIASQTGGRLRPYCNFSFRGLEDPEFAERTREVLRTCKELGAVGVKLFKSVGLGIVLADGTLLAVDDPRIDVLFETAGELGLPVLIHSGDPQAFFRPPTPDNERYEELEAHPSWSFYGPRPDGAGNWPSWEEVFAQYERRVARHPRTKFLGAHFGNAPEDPERIATMLERHANLYVETGARIPEIGRHDPTRMHDLFVRFADRILFGTDLAVTPDGLTLGSSGRDPDPPERVPEFFMAHWRYFETNGRGMTHPTPIQGNWTIDGIGLPPEVLEKLYYRNAMALFGLPDPRTPNR